MPNGSFSGGSGGDGQVVTLAPPGNSSVVASVLVLVRTGRGVT